MESASNPKGKLFRTAARLLCQRTRRAVGVAAIAAEAGIARSTHLAEQAGVPQPQALVDSLLLRLGETYIAVRVSAASPDNPAASMAVAAQQLIEGHCEE